MLHLACSAGSNNRHIYSLGHRPGQGNVVAVLGAVSIHAGQQNLSCPQLRSTLYPLNHINAGRSPAAVDIDLPLFLAAAAGIHGQHNALAAKLLRSLADDIRIFYGSRIDRGLVRSCLQHFPHILSSADTTANSKGNKHLGGTVPCHLHDGITLLIGSGNIKEYQLIAPLQIIAVRQLHRVPGITKAHEIRALYYAPPLDIKAGNNTLCVHIYASPVSALSTSAIASCKSRLPV